MSSFHHDTTRPLSASRNRLRALCWRGIAFASLLGALSGTAQDIPAIDWTPRSDWIDVRDFGAVPDDDQDDSVGIQAAIDSLDPYRRKNLYLPPGTYRLTRTLRWGVNGQGASLYGHGSRTVLEWWGAADGTMLVSNGGRDGTFCGLSWDGRGLAAVGIDHRPIQNYETMVRHEHEAFRNFRTAGLRAGSETAEGASPTAETMVWNCLFADCAIGLSLGEAMYNCYLWQIKDCAFLRCGTGVNSPKGRIQIVDTHFEGSTGQDLSVVDNTVNIRRVTSVGSNRFLVTGQPSSNQIPSFIADCRISDWTDPAGAIQIHRLGPWSIVDCAFSNPPSTDPPIRLDPRLEYPQQLILADCASPETDGLVHASPDDTLLWLSTAAPQGQVASAYQQFLRSAPVSDAATVIDVTSPPYSASTDGSGDQSGALQAALDAASRIGPGALVYLPPGLYRLDQGVAVDDADFQIQGGGYWSKVSFLGETPQPALTIRRPRGLILSNLSVASRSDADTKILVIGDDAADLVVDAINLSRDDSYPWNANSVGLKIADMGAGGLVHLRALNGPLTLEDCGGAEVFGEFPLCGPLTVRGPTTPPTGFLGFLVSAGVRTEAGASHTIADNQSFICAQLYTENAGIDFLLSGADQPWSGRVSLDCQKQHGVSDILVVHNYRGEFTYAGNSFYDRGTPKRFVQDGESPFSLLLLGNNFGSSEAQIEGNAHLQLHGLLNTVRPTGSDNLPTLETPFDPATQRLAQGYLDDLRRLGAYDLQWTHAARRSLLGRPLSTVPTTDSTAGLELTAAGPGTIHLDWADIATNGHGYRVERATARDGAFTTVASVGPASTSFTDRGLADNTTYHYRIVPLETPFQDLPATTVRTFSSDEAWRFQSFGDASVTAASADSADPDGDGWENLLEYATRQDPLRPQPSVSEISLLPSNRLSLTFQRGFGGNVICEVFAGPRPNDTGSKTLLARIDPDSAGWTIVQPGADVSVKTTPAGEEITVTDSALVTPQTPRYLWLEVRRP